MNAQTRPSFGKRLAAAFRALMSDTHGGSPAGAAGLNAQDYIDIQQLYAAYALAVDMGDGPGRAAVFTPDGTFTSSNQGNVPQPVAVIAERTAKQGNIGDRHLQYNIRIQPTPEGAKGTCYVLIVRGKQSRSGTIVGSLQMYDDTFVRTAAGWRFKSRHIWSDTAEGSPYRARE